MPRKEIEYGGWSGDCYRDLMRILNSSGTDDYDSLISILEAVDYDETSLRTFLGLLTYDEEEDFYYDATGSSDLGGIYDDLALVGGEIITDELGLDCFWDYRIFLLSTEDTGGF